MDFPKQINQQYNYSFKIFKSGLAAIFVSAPFRVERLKDPLTNIRYVAAKIHFSQNRWEKAGFDIKDKPEILGTLYNIEEIDKPIDPHANPETNEFGEGVRRNYNKVKKLLGL